MRKIYIAKSVDHSPMIYKVGISKDPAFRIKVVSYESRIGCRLMYTIEAHQDWAVEQAIHKELKPYLFRIRPKSLEWYEADFYLILDCVERAVRDFHCLRVPIEGES